MATEQTAEQQIEALEKQVSTLEKKSLQQEKLIEAHKGTIDTQGKEISDLKKAVAEKVEHIRSLNQEAEATEKVLEQLTVKQRVAEASAEAGAPVIEHDGQHYLVAIPVFQFNGKKTTAEQLKKDAALVAELVAAGSGVLRKVE